MKKVIVIFVIFLSSCDWGCRTSKEPITSEVLPYGVVGKPYYIEVTVAIGINKPIIGFTQDEIRVNDSGLKWEFTEIYRNPNRDPKKEVTSNSISIYGTPTRAGNIIIYAESYTIKTDFIKPHIDISPIYKKFHIKVLEEEPTY